VQPPIQTLVRRIVSQVRPLRIILFGSFARGDFTTSSRLDLCIIVTTAEEPSERARLFRALTRMDDMVVKPYVYTADEFKRLIEVKDSLALRIVSEGKTLYEQP
jgi:predicted nucleotidyltransferase